MFCRVTILLFLLLCVSGCYFPYDSENPSEYDAYWLEKEEQGQIKTVDPLKSEDTYDVSPGT